ncbi:MAG: hypothetical protein L6R37_006696 [Teloschistes peruensis]|nr:MAG: hypothetical protein L6R37_006696 [Teloschistes peruensis]
MKSSHATIALLLSFAYPLAVFGQHRHGGGGNNQFNRAPVNSVPTTTAPPPVNTGSGEQPVVTQAPIVTQGSTGNGNGNGNNRNGNGNGNGETTTDSSGGGNTGGTCSAVPGNMNVQLSGANVDFRFEPPVAGNPTTGKTGDCSVWTFPSGWSGRVHVGGGSGAPFGSTLYEGNWGSNGKGAMDVSFVEGFSVPMLCTDNSNNFISGCGIDLFTTGTCPTGGSAGGVCTNPQGPGGTRDSKDKPCEACSPPDPFFGPCSSAGFAFPTDDAANDGISGADISCSIGPSSVRTGREGNTAETGQPEAGRCEVCSGSTKRALEEVLFGRDAGPSTARSPSMLPRVHKRTALDVLGLGLGKRSHRHGAVAHR